MSQIKNSVIRSHRLRHRQSGADWPRESGKWRSFFPRQIEAGND